MATLFGVEGEYEERACLINVRGAADSIKVETATVTLAVVKILPTQNIPSSLHYHFPQTWPRRID